MKLVSYINYLNFGDSLKYFENMDFKQINTSMLKKEIISLILNDYNGNEFLLNIIKDYGLPNSKKINMNKLKIDLYKTLKARTIFASLKCRGFSYKFYSQIKGFPNNLKSHINLKMALMSDADLFYPDRVKKYLRSVNTNHYFFNNFPSISFAFGTEIENSWYIFILQSDIALRKPAYIRDHFRGWRKILFANILRNGLEKGIKNIYLCRAIDILKCCHPDFFKPEKLPKSWKVIYDDTAKFFNMRKVNLKEKINIQILRKAKSLYCSEFYKLKITQKLEKQINIYII